MQRSPWQDFDWGLLLIAVALTLVGLAMIYSATLGSVDIDLANTWRRQAIYATIGVGLMFLVASVDYRLLESLEWPVYFVTIGVLIFTLLLGTSEIGEVRRFIYIGGTSIQPAFPALLLLIVSQAGLLARNAPDPPGFREFIASLGLTGLAAFLVFITRNATASLAERIYPGRGFDLLNRHARHQRCVFRRVLLDHRAEIGISFGAFRDEGFVCPAFPDDGMHNCQEDVNVGAGLDLQE